MKKICFVTAARSEYGLLRWIMKAVQECTMFEMQLLVTGGHLLEEQGYTINQIIEDGFNIDDIVNVQINSSTECGIAIFMGNLASRIALSFEHLSPDLLVVLGDRYELLPICNTAMIMGIPIAHFSGGDVTEGAIDDSIRNAVTMMATYHFPGTEEAAKNIIRMTGRNKNIWMVGEPGLEAFRHINAMNREELACSLGLDVSKKWVLLTFHPVTQDSLSVNLDTAENIARSMLDLGEQYQIVITYANADYGGNEINKYFHKISLDKPDQIVQIPSLGQKRYLSFMKQAKFIIGNSSSGIVESAYFKIPTVNVGNRQMGRHLCSNIVQCGNSYDDIKAAIEQVLDGLDINDDSYYWGDGYTSDRVVDVLKSL